MNTRKSRGEIYVKIGLITEEQLQSIQPGHRTGKQGIEEKMISSGLATREQIVETISSKLKIPIVSCEGRWIPRELKALVAKDVAQSRIVLPIEKKDSTLVLAMADPLDYRTIDYIAFTTKLKVSPAICRESEILESIERNYTASAEHPASSRPDGHAPLPGKRRGSGHKNSAAPFGAALDGAKEISFLEEKPRDEDTDASLEVLYSKSETPSVVKLVSSIVAEAARMLASDIHIEPREKYTQVRFRIDGELRNIFRFDRNIHDSVVSRIKIVSHLDITNRRLPQDGSASIAFQGKEVDLRISTAPSIYGEKIVIRLLDQSTGLLPFEALSMSDQAKEAIGKIMNRPQGMLIVTGPTGSGKTTTLYACLNQLRSEKRNIITIEDPVEYKLDGITQIQIDEGIGRTFSVILRSVLRQDPDIIKIGEIRDLETAEIAIKAALTGHFVLTTLHTNSTIATITRLLNIGLPPYLLSSAISGILAQRLVRRICDHCKVESPVSEEIEKFSSTFGLPIPEKHYHGMGCSRCSGQGYSGRVAIYEYLSMTPKLRRVLAKTINEHEIVAEAKNSGLTFLFEDAWNKVIAGVTTVDEVIAKVPIEFRLGAGRRQEPLPGLADESGGLDLE